MKRKDFNNEEFLQLKKENSSLKSHVNSLKKEIKKIKSQLKTVNQAWDKTEFYLKDVVKGRSLESVISNVNTSGKLSTIDDHKCKKCGTDYDTLKLNKMTILNCKKCKYKEVLNDKKK